MEEQKKTKVAKTKDILEEVKEIDRRVRAKIVYDKISTIKSWAREIAELKEKTQVLLEELGVESEDIKRLIDYATNSPEARLTEADKKDIRDDIKDDIADSKEKVEKKMESMPFAAVMTAASVPYTSTVNVNDGSTTVWTSGTSGTGTTSSGSTYNVTGGDDAITFAMK